MSQEEKESKLTLSGQLDMLLLQIKDLKVEAPIDRKYFERIQAKHGHHHHYIGAKHGDPIIQKEYPAVKENAPLFINKAIYGQMFRTFSVFYLHANKSNDQDKLITVMQMLERHTQLIEIEQLKNPDDPVYLYALAQTTLEILTTLKIMSDAGIDNGLSEHEKDLLKGLALHFNEHFTSQLALFTTSQEAAATKEEEEEEKEEEQEAEVDEEDVEVGVENVEAGY